MLVVASVMSALGSLRSPGPPTVAVIVAAHDIPSGHSLTASDLTLVETPSQAVPPARLTGSIEQLTNGTLVTAQRLDAGVALTASSVIDGDPWDVGPGNVAVAVRFADPALAGLIGPHQVLTLISASGAGAVELTDSARLLTTIDAQQSSSLVGSDSQTPALVVMAVDAEVATLVLDASAGGTLTAVMRSADSP